MLFRSLESAVRALDWKPAGTEWADYYDSTNYTRAAFDEKRRIIDGWLERTQPKTAWDLGANNGVFSRLASGRGIQTVAFDIDPAAVEQNYRECRSKIESNLLPLVMDLTNPSPAIGWENREREQLESRGPADLVLALALIHHLAISNNVPLERLAESFARLGRWLAIEFVPKEDSQVQRLLATREDIFPAYTVQGFEQAFALCFDIVDKMEIHGSKRTLYLMKSKRA